MADTEEHRLPCQPSNGTGLICRRIAMMTAIEENIDREVLDEAVEMYRAAVEATARDHPTIPGGGLGIQLITRPLGRRATTR